ncbi:MAG TPA: penicillin-binding protein 2 [Thermoleophilaceae bacterium]|nr:penicillin-binding protein 2 [Thermoleophilaceae bacterium]
MNRQIVQLFGLSMLLFATLIAFTSRWAVFEAESLENEPSNRRPLIEEQRIPRGLVLARDGTVLARSVARGSGAQRTYTRSYPTGGLFSHAVGYNFISKGRAGLERSKNDELIGEESEFGSIFSQLQSKAREGQDVTTTLDPKGQRAALAALGGRRGSIVAIEPQTGRVRVMVSVPEYDPNDVPERFRQLNSGEGAPLLNRATQSRYPPGSTFKVVTAAAALDTGGFTPQSIVDGSSPRPVSGVPLANAGGQDFGPLPLTDALTNSVNTVWAQVGERLGRGTLIEYMERFGFNKDPELDYPDSQMSASGVRDARGRLLDGDGGFDVGRVAIGQGGSEGGIQVSPLQMAMVAGAVGNRGRLMRPRLTEKVVAKDGRVTERVEPEEQSIVMSQKAAGMLAQMMGNVVKEGTGTAAALSGIEVAGKTGTAEVDNATANQAWFIGFAPIDRPRMAVAVTIERTQGQGGTEAAPLAKRVLEALIGGAA